MRGFLRFVYSWYWKTLGPIILLLIVAFVIVFVLVRLSPPWLNAEYWQGIAGIAQIFAAVLAIVTVLQAKQMMDEAEKQRWESVAPHWVYLENDLVPALAVVNNTDYKRAGGVLSNTGYGPAIDIRGQKIGGGQRHQ